MRGFLGVLTGCLLLVSGCEQPPEKQADTETPAAEQAVASASGATEAPTESEPEAVPQPVYNGLLGPDNPKVVQEAGRTRIWAGGSEYFDFTDAPLDPEKLQYGIGKDRIRSIDDPLYVKPDDPRLMQFRVSRYRPDEKAETIDEIMVIGYAVGDQVRAYPTALLDRHELVNDTIGGKPVTVGW